MHPPTFTGLDIGSPRQSGRTSQSSTRLEITAGGEDIWGSRDEFHFAHLRVAGDFELSARLVSLEMADLYTKAGLMVRATLGAESEHVLLLAFGDNQPRNKNNGGLEFQSRLVANGPCTGIYPPQPLAVPPDFPVNFPKVWLQLSRTGDTFAARSSQDGITWKTFCVHRQLLPQEAYVGLAVTSHHAGRTVTAVFSDLQFKGVA